MDVTAKFQSSIPYTLQSVSPALAALHTRRIRKLSSVSTDSESNNSRCGKCGLYLFAGDSSTRVVRIKYAKRRRTDAPTRTHSNNSSTRARQSTCLQCGWVNEFPLDRVLFPIRQSSSSNLDDLSDAAQPHRLSIADAKFSPGPNEPYVESRATSSQQRTATSRLSKHEGSNLHSVQKSEVVSTSIPLPTRPKSRPKKKSGLHELLAQNRAKEEKAKKASSGGQSSLAAFLDTL